MPAELIMPYKTLIYNIQVDFMYLDTYISDVNSTLDSFHYITLSRQ